MNLKKIGILGLARSGIAAARKIRTLGGEPFLSEKKEMDQVPEAEILNREFECEFGGHSSRLLENDIIVVSPGIHREIPIHSEAREQGIEIISEIELGYRLKAKDSKIIAVTGSNGKSTTVSLIFEILKNAGYNALLGGNIGTAFTSLPIEKEGIDFIVLEISSFQLELIRHFRPRVALLLNITPDHLNRYGSFELYAETKFRIFTNQRNQDLSIINKDDRVIREFDYDFQNTKKQFSLVSQADAWFEDGNLRSEDLLLPVNELKLKGPHNHANCLAAVLALSELNIDKNILQRTLIEFQPLTHRLELVASIRGIQFVNDSKATNTDSVRYALQSFPVPIRMIMGGRGKGENYGVLSDLIRKKVRKLYLIGESRFEMKEIYGNIVEIELFDDLETAVNRAFLESVPGDYVVLSPACASFDMFLNFEERGEKFKKIIAGLK